MTVLRNSIPVRVKFILLMVGALTASLGSILGAGMAIFIDDKGSYILDYNLTQVQSAASSVENQIQKILMTSNLLHLYREKSDPRAIEKVFQETSKALKLKRLLILDIEKAGTLKITTSLGDDDGSLAHHLDQLGWDSLRFLNDPVLVGKAAGGDLAVGTLITKSTSGGKGTAYIFFITPDLNLPETASDFQVYLVDSTGDTLYSNHAGTQTAIKKTQMAEILKSVFEGKITAGVRKWSNSQDDYLASYRRLDFKELTVVGLIAERTAFAAVKMLFLRSIVLGISVLLIAVGLALLFLKQLTDGLRAMMAVTEKVAEGTFAFRVDTKGMGNDEIGALATSFNLMAGKIDELMTEVANKIEVKHDRETVVAVQGNLFPDTPLEHKQITFTGKSIFSRQCGGDWWHYDQIGDYVILIVGKVEGRGLTAAMLTAAAHGAASTFTATTKMINIKNPNLKFLVTHLNTAIFEAAKGRQKLACFVALFDTHSGELQMVNAGHPIPYLHRLKHGGRPGDPTKRFEPIPLKKNPPLGSAESIKIDPDLFQLQAGDMLFWYTVGLIKTLNLKGEDITTKRIFDYLANAYDEYDCQADKISASMIDEATKFFGEVAEAPPDDITVAVLAVPKKAYFVEREEIA